MFYRAIGIMSGSSLDGLDICFVELDEIGGKWSFDIKASACLPYEKEWVEKLKTAIHLNALEYVRLHAELGHYIGKKVNDFITLHQLNHRVQLIASHGHTTFHEPERKMTGQIGDGAAIAAETGINVVSDLRAMDVALGGQGAPIVPIGEKLLLGNYNYFLNLGGIANISNTNIAFDVCPANRVLNMLVQQMGHDYDDGGAIAATGTINNLLLNELNELDYYVKPYPKSLANDFGTDVVYKVIEKYNCTIPDALATMVEHTAIQIANAIEMFPKVDDLITTAQMLVTGGGAFNHFLIERIQAQFSPLELEIVVADKTLIEFKEALIMALMGVLRWREESNVLKSVTGASRSSIGGAVWIGQDA
jgi:anhydro-N-acetylmuramic acid kinase